MTDHWLKPGMKHYNWAKLQQAQDSLTECGDKPTAS